MSGASCCGMIVLSEVMADFENISSKEQLPLRLTSGNIMKRSHFYKQRHLYYITVPSKIFWA